MVADKFTERIVEVYDAIVLNPRNTVCASLRSHMALKMFPPLDILTRIPGL